MRRSRIYALLAVIAICLTAQGEESKFKVSPTGQLAIDGGLFVSPQKEQFKDGIAMPEMRVGAKMSYEGWSAAIQAGYAYGKVGLKDAFIRYDFNGKNYVKVGNFIHYFGLQSVYGALSKPAMQETVSSNVFADGRLLGAMLVHADDKFLASFSAHVEPAATTVFLDPDHLRQQGYGFRSRLSFHPFQGEGWVVQIGAGVAFESPRYSGSTPDTHDVFTFSSNWPTKVARVEALSCSVDKAMNLWKVTPGILLIYHKLAMESQYYFRQVNRRQDLQAFRSQGAYVMLRGMLLGGDYIYNKSSAAITSFNPKSLEAIICYDYTNLSDASAAIFGGRMNDFSATLNYYFNKYFTARFRYGYSYCWDRAGFGPMTLNSFQLRLQVVF